MEVSDSTESYLIGYALFMPVRFSAVISNGLSIVGCMMIIVTYALWPHLRTTSRFLLACLSVGDYLNSAGMLVAAIWNPFPYAETRPGHFTNAGCKTQAFVTTAGSLMSFFWTTSMAVYLYVTIVKNNIRRANRLVLVFHVVSWGVPMILTVSALGCDRLGFAQSSDAASWCWITDQGERSVTYGQKIWMVATGKGWEILSYVLVIFFYFAIKWHLRNTGSRGQFLTRSSYEAVQSANRKLTFVPVVFVLLRMWGTIRFFLVVFNSKAAANTVLRVFHAIGDGGQGAANCILFCIFSANVRQQWVKTFFPCWKGVCKCKIGRSTPTPRTPVKPDSVQDEKDREDSSLLSSVRQEKSVNSTGSDQNIQQ